MNYGALISSVRRVYDSFLVRSYIAVRFRVINPRILDTILSYFRREGDLLVLGCGFGLFDLLLGLRWPEKRTLGLDHDASRIGQARRAAERLGLRNNAFEVRDLAKQGIPARRFDEILMLDLLHHLPPETHWPLLDACHHALLPGGTLVIKDIHRHSRAKLLFTRVLDSLMTRGAPVCYRHEDDLLRDLRGVGFEHVVSLRVDDLLPYPHIQYVCIKGRGAAPGD